MGVQYTHKISVYFVQNANIQTLKMGVYLSQDKGKANT